MSESEKIILSIEENAQAFFNEAIEKVLQASGDARHWQFAILHLVQSLELSLKSLLKKVHPVLVYENVDNPKNMIGLNKAIQRLEQPIIKGVIFSENEKYKVQKAIELRNEITHSNFEFSVVYAEKKYFELLAFVISFQSKHLGVEVEDFVEEEKFEKLLDIERSRAELLKKAQARIEEENISDELVIACPKCTEQTFVIEENADICFLCRYSEPTIECPQCKEFHFEGEIESFGEAIDYQYEEGENVIYNDYGYSNFYACPNCLPKILDDIQNKRDKEDYFLMMQQETYRDGC